MCECVLLIAECPSCQTRFRVTEEQLAVANGRVRCGACLAVFDGCEALQAPPATVDDDPIEVLLACSRPADPPEAAQTETAADPASESVPVAAREEPPVSPRGARPVVYGAGIAAALALLVAGVLVVQYDAFVQHPVLRDVYVRIGVDVPGFKALDAIRVTNRSVDERPGDPADLVVRMDLVNTAGRTQPFPTLAVRFHRTDGTFLAEQRVAPGAYLPSPTHTRRMMPNKTTSVRLRLDDPGPEAASYSVALQ